MSSDLASGAERQPTAMEYPVPVHLARYLTSGGRDAFVHEVDRYARALAGELHHLVTDALDSRKSPELTEEKVSAARAQYERRLSVGASSADQRQPDERPQPRSSLLAAILLTVASAGVGVMPNFLNSPWQYGLFVVLIIVGVIGLVLTWVSGTRGKGRSAAGSAGAMTHAPPRGATAESGDG